MSLLLCQQSAFCNRWWMSLAFAAFFSTSASAQLASFFGWIEPGCPRAGDAITIYASTGLGGSGALQLTGNSTNVTRTGNTIRVVHVPSFSLGAAGDVFGTAATGPLEAGNYRVEIFGSTFLVGVMDIAVGVAPGEFATVWYNTSVPGYGISLYRGNTSINGAMYTHTVAREPLWVLLQRAYCTPTGFTGLMYHYGGGVPIASPDPAAGPPLTATRFGTWAFTSIDANQAQFRQLYPDPALNFTRNVSKLMFP